MLYAALVYIRHRLNRDDAEHKKRGHHHSVVTADACVVTRYDYTLGEISVSLVQTLAVQLLDLWRNSRRYVLGFLCLYDLQRTAGALQKYLPADYSRELQSRASHIYQMLLLVY